MRGISLVRMNIQADKAPNESYDTSKEYLYAKKSCAATEPANKWRNREQQPADHRYCIKYDE
jgi:hypothetical protein